VGEGEFRTWLFSGEIINIRGHLRILSVIIDITERKKTEELLHFSDLALKSIHEGVYAMDNDLKITRWNETCEQMFGVKASDAIGKMPAASMKIVEQYSGQIETRIETLMQTGFIRDEQVFRTPHGDIWIDAQVQAIEYNGKRYGWLTLLSDISERKKTEAALKHSEEKYRELINTSTDAIISTDAAMKVLIWNNGAEKIFGHTEKEMLGQPVVKIVPDMAQKTMVDEFNNFVKVDKGIAPDQVQEITGIKKDGTLIPIEVSMSIRKTADSFIATGIIRDITTRKEVQEALKRSEEKYRELINTSNDAIVSIDSQMRFILWNQAAEKMLGYTEKEILGLSLLTIFPETSQNNVARELVQLKKTGFSTTINRPFETNLLKKDCSLVPVDMAISTRQSDDLDGDYARYHQTQRGHGKITRK
jgi:PAS domain S-box-containing protein